jgi:hypothetical protein
MRGVGKVGHASLLEVSLRQVFLTKTGVPDSSIDFNIQPSEAAYRLLTGAPLTSAQEEDLALSSVVHTTVDKLSEKGCSEKLDEEDVGESGVDPDRVLSGCRPASIEDGLLSLGELKGLFSATSAVDQPRSLYGQSHGLVEGEKGNFYGERAEGMHLVSETQEAKRDGLASAWDGLVTEEERIIRGYYEPKWSE